MAMSIDEAIQHCEEMALCAKNGECGEEHRQLAEWLRELKRLRAEPVRHGRWELTTHSFYRDTFDESCELCVYIVANCSESSGKHPNSYQVFSKTLYAPDDADDDFRFDQKAEEEKALLEFRNKKYEFAYYCPNCGAKMDGGVE